MADSIGMMEGAFFVSRNELLGWINDLLKLNLTKVEQLGTGAVYCQILDACYTGEVAMHRVNWRARYDYEFLNNYKVLQQAFTKLKIQKTIDVSKLSKAKYQDNLEFGQWMKRFFELKFGNEGKSGYDALERRGPVEPELAFTEKSVPSKTSATPANGAARKNSEPAADKSTQPMKKVKLYSVNPKAEGMNEFDKENVKPFDFGRLKRECEELSGKLRNVEEIVMGSQDADEIIMGRLREFFGIKLTGSLQCQKGAAEHGDLDMTEENSFIKSSRVNMIEQTL